jgi:hypothetical protein
LYSSANLYQSSAFENLPQDRHTTIDRFGRPTGIRASILVSGDLCWSDLSKLVLEKVGERAQISRASTRSCASKPERGALPRTR